MAAMQSDWELEWQPCPRTTRPQNFPLSGVDDRRRALWSDFALSRFPHGQTPQHTRYKAPIESNGVRGLQLCLVSHIHFIFEFMYIGEVMIHL